MHWPLLSVMIANRGGSENAGPCGAIPIPSFLSILFSYGAIIAHINLIKYIYFLVLLIIYSALILMKLPDSSNEFN